MTFVLFLMSFSFASDCVDSGIDVASDVLIFSSLKPCERDSNVFVAQQNALQSWIGLRPRCHVAVFGDEPGVAELVAAAAVAAASASIHHVKHVVRGPGELPLVNELFQAAERLADSLGNVRMLVYTNGDILFTDELRLTLSFLLDDESAAPTTRNRELFLVGKRYDSNRFANKRIDPRSSAADDDWQAAIRAAAHRIAPDFKHNDNRWALDYFAWTRGFFNRNPQKISKRRPSGVALLLVCNTTNKPIVPPFSLGIVAFDNWLLHYANTMAKQLPADVRPIVVDASLVVPAVHQFHAPTKNSSEKPVFYCCCRLAASRAMFSSRVRVFRC